MDTRIIGFVSGKGGVGKTTLSVNIGVALAQMGNSVSVIDTDFSASNLATYLGHYNHPVTIQDILAGRAEPGHGLFQHPTGIKAMIASNEIDQVTPDTEELRPLIEASATSDDYVLVDCPPGIGSTVNDVITAVDEVVVVTEPTQTAGVNAAQVVEQALDLKKPVLGTVINKMEDEPDRELIEKEVEIMTNSQILSTVPDDPLVKESLFNNTPVVHNEPLTDASIEIKRLAATLDGKQYQEPSFLKLRQAFNRLTKKMQSD